MLLSTLNMVHILQNSSLFKGCTVLRRWGLNKAQPSWNVNSPTFHQSQFLDSTGKGGVKAEREETHQWTQGSSSCTVTAASHMYLTPVVNHGAFSSRSNSWCNTTGKDAVELSPSQTGHTSNASYLNQCLGVCFLWVIQDCGRKPQVYYHNSDSQGVCVTFCRN